MNMEDSGFVYLHISISTLAVSSHFSETAALRKRITNEGITRQRRAFIT